MRGARNEASGAGPKDAGIAAVGVLCVAIICRFIGHRRDRHRIWNDGRNFRASCVRCGVAMIKLGDGDWKPYDESRDAPPDGSARDTR